MVETKETVEILKEMDQVDEEIQELEKKLFWKRLRKMELNILLMQTPEMREAYKEAYRKVRNMHKRG